MTDMTDTTAFISELTGGAFEQQIGMAISDVAKQVVKTGKKGQVKITLDMSLLGEVGGGQVNIKHKLEYNAPETFGTRKEDYARETPMHVNLDGSVTLFSQSAQQLFGQEV